VQNHPKIGDLVDYLKKEKEKKSQKAQLKRLKHQLWKAKKNNQCISYKRYEIT